MRINKFVCRIFSAIVLLLCLKISNAQEISGIITDANTQEPIPFANVWIRGTTHGVSTDFDGKFTLLAQANTTLCFSSVGYIKDSVQVTPNVHTLNCQLKPNVREIEEIVVKPDFTYDKQLFKQVLKHKKDNERALRNVDTYEQQNTTTVLLATDDETNWIKKSKLEDYTIAISDSTPKNMLPVYFTHELNNVRFSNKQKDIHTVSSKKDGIFPMLNQQIESMVLDKIAIDFNFYDNQVIILNRGFISPLSNNALLYYNIYLSDSCTIDSQKFYRFSFYPKNEHSVVFKGHFWVEDSSFAVTHVQAILAPKANLNFIHNLHVSVNYKKLETGTWFYDNQQVDMQFSLTQADKPDSADAPGYVDLKGGELFICKKSNYNQSDPVVLETADVFEPASQLKVGHNLESKAVENINEIKNNKFIKSVDKIGGMFLTGYYPKGIIDIGPVFDMYTTNFVEGDRLTLPIRTNAHLFNNFSVGGYLGYGTKSKEVKYGAQLQFGLNEDKSSVLSLKYSDDYISVSSKKFTQFIKENPYSKGDGNLVSSFTSKTRNPYMMGQQKIEARYEVQINKNLGVFINPYHTQNTTTQYVPFAMNDKRYTHYTNYGMLLNFRFSFHQDYDQLYFSRLYYTNLKPVINLGFDLGEVYVPTLKKERPTRYLHTHVSIKNRFNLGISYIKLMANAGYIYGNVPYTMLETPSGTQSLGFSRFNYNLLDHASFAHNLYANMHFNLNGGGVLLNHVPYLSHLHLREMVSLKCYYGKLTSNYRGMFELPAAFSNNLNMPYAELGVGLTNIFKVLRVEYVHRLNNNPAINNYSVKHGIRMRFEVSF